MVRRVTIIAGILALAPAAFAAKTAAQIAFLVESADTAESLAVVQQLARSLGALTTSLYTTSAHVTAAGRDLALLQWAAAARHWLVLVLAAQVFLPHPTDPWLQLAVLPVVLVALCGALALTETLVAKMRILLAPRLLGIAALLALLGVVVWLVEAA